MSATTRAATTRAATTRSERRDLVAVLANASTGGQAREWRRQVQWQMRRLMWPVAIVTGFLALWSALAPLAGAIVAPAQLRVEFKRKTVQHQEGGIVRELLVRDGQTVRAGDPLLVVGDAGREADLNLLRDQWLAVRARAERAEAEQRFAAGFDPTDALRRDGVTSEHVARERALFRARRQSLDEQSALLQAQARHAQAQTDALGTQADSIVTSAKLSDEELAINERLLAQGFVSRTRLLSLQRAANDYRSQLGEARGEQAAARQRIGELQSRIAQLRFTYQTQAADEAKEAATRAREFDERLRASADRVERQVVRAPVDGAVMSLRIAAVGDVVAPREPLLEVVPSREKLIVDARIEPQDIEHVRTGGAVEVSCCPQR